MHAGAVRQRARPQMCGLVERVEEGEANSRTLSQGHGDCSVEFDEF